MTIGIAGTAAHIHDAAIGMNGPVIIPLTKNGSPGSMSISFEQASGVRALAHGRAKVSPVLSRSKARRVFLAEGPARHMINAACPRAVKCAVLAFVAFDRASDSVPEPKGNGMSKLMIALFVAAGLGVVGSAAAQMSSPMSVSTPMSKDSYTLAKTNADAQYKIDKDACAAMSGNGKDICLAQAKGKEGIAKADAEAAYENTPKAREAARVAHAQASYDVSMEKCDDLAGNRKDVCVKEADAALVKGKADAKVDRVAADTRHDAAAKQADASKEANADKRDAEYKVALEKCDAFAGPAKDACVSSAKVQFSKS